MMPKNVKKMVAASIGLMMIPIGAIAAPLAVNPPATKAKPSAVVQELTAMEQQGALLQQQLKNALLQQEIANAQKTNTATIKPGAILGSTSLRGPSVLLLTGGNNRYTATIQLPNGQMLPAMVGGLLPGGYRITKISSDGVWTRHAGKMESLPFAVANHPDQDSSANLLGAGFSSAGLSPSAGPLQGAGLLPSSIGATGMGLQGDHPNMMGLQSAGMQPAGQP
jgi:type IV pilus biogenesis protein PilP